MLTVRGNNKISQIQKEFTTAFPFLKLEFFNQLHKVHEASPKKALIKTDILLKERIKGNSEIVINEEMPVSLLERLFMETFGISVQVFRKSGRSWLETTRTDDWTLRRQNDEGKELSMFN